MTRQALLLATLGFGAACFGTAGPSLRFGVGYLDVLALCALFAAIVAALSGGIALLTAALPWRRRACLATALLCGVFVSAVVLGFQVSMKIKLNMFRALASSDTASTLVTAIHRFQDDRSNPPGSLTDLIPQFLSAVPSTGMVGYPEFKYRTDTTDNGNPWRLEVQCGGPGINFDILLYLPNQNYPPYGYGGRLERMGRWAYVHE